MSIYILNLNPCYDHWVIMEKPSPVKNVLRADKVVKVVNGKGLDIARVLHTLNFEDYNCINILGGQVGKIIEQAYKKENLRCIDFWIEDENRTNTAVVYEYDESMLMINEPGPLITNDELSDFSEFLRMGKYLNRKQLSPEDYLVVSGSACRGIDGRNLIELVKFFSSFGVKIAVDIAGDWLKKIITESLEVLKINTDELSTAFGISWENHSEIARFRKTNGIRYLIITHGKKGSYLYTDRKVYKASPTVSHSNYAVGSGDSYFAGLLKSFSQGKDIVESLKLATACGIANTIHYGAGIMTRDEIFENYNNVEISEVNV